MPFLLAEILNFQGSTHRIGVGSFSYILKKEQTSYDENEFTRLFDKYLRPKPAFYAVLNTALQL